MKNSQQDVKAWKYVGRFLASFADIESIMDGIFGTMFNLNAVSTMFLLPNLEFHKKMRLIKLGFEYQKQKYGKAFQEIDELNRVRNIIAHSQFSHVQSYMRRYKAGVEFSYVDKDGNMPTINPEINEKRKKDHERKKKTNKKRTRKETHAANRMNDILPADEWNLFPDKQTITYAQFDKYDTKAKNLIDTLMDIQFEPINNGIEFLRDISEIISSSENVLPFPTPSPK
jgi:hypothetical protein